MSEEIKVDAPAVEEPKTETAQTESKPEEAKPVEESKPAEESKSATEATPAQKEAIAALSEEDRESLAARASKQSTSSHFCHDKRLTNSQLLLLRLQPSHRPILLHLDHVQQGRMGSYRDYLDFQANEGV